MNNILSEKHSSKKTGATILHVAQRCYDVMQNESCLHIVQTWITSLAYAPQTESALALIRNVCETSTHARSQRNAFTLHFISCLQVIANAAARNIER